MSAQAAMPSSPSPPPTGRSRRAALYAAAWLLCAGLYAAGFASFGATPSQAIRAAVAIVVPWAVVGLVVLRAARAIPWPAEDGRARVILMHVALALAFVALSVAGWYLLVLADMRLVMGTPMKFTWRAVPYQILNSSLVYAALVGSTYARQNAARVREESARAARAELLRAGAELAALRSQLNPHFLLNTLHAALGLVRRDPALAERALERLGELLHYGLRMHREGLDQVTLGEEWAFVRSYLEIEGLRLEERLQLRLEAEPETLECPVPPFVLQPLVENAVLHAVAPRKQGGRIEVTARLRGERLQLEVCDDGPGMPAAASTPGAGLGLQLLRDRLAQLYGGKAALSLHTAESGGVRATLDLPLDFEASVEPS